MTEFSASRKEFPSSLLRRRRTDRPASRFGTLPTPLREHADPEFTGKGVTIAFLGTGFSRHADLSKPTDRIRGYVDVTGENASLDTQDVSHWHGTVTAVVAAGNGHLSGGVYRSLAPEADLVLVKIARQGEVSESDLLRGIDWVLTHREKYGIKVLNIPLEAPLEHANFEEAIRQGITVVASAGFCELEAPVRPGPITVGGYDDQGEADLEGIQFYAHRSGLDADGFPRPEVIAPAAYVAAPILAGTPMDRRSDAVFQLARATDRALPKLVDNLRSQAELPSWLNGLSAREIRQTLEHLAEQEKFVNPHYQHMDSASFASSIVSSVVAEMLQANPGLSPSGIRQILIGTAERVSNAPNLLQGFGVVNPREAVARARQPQPQAAPAQLAPRVEGQELVFNYADAGAHAVFLAGDFNGWDYTRNPFAKIAEGRFRCRIPVPERGKFRYKLVVDGKWIVDPANLRKEEDQFKNVNSVLWLS